MRRLGRLGSAALAGSALLLMAACAHTVPAPTASPTLSVAPISTPAGETATPSAVAGSPSSTAASSSSAAGDASDQIDNQINNQLNQIDNEIGQANQGLATSEGDPAQ